MVLRSSGLVASVGSITPTSMMFPISEATGVM